MLPQPRSDRINSESLPPFFPWEIRHWSIRILFYFCLLCQEYSQQSIHPLTESLPQRGMVAWSPQMPPRPSAPCRPPGPLRPCWRGKAGSVSPRRSQGRRDAGTRAPLPTLTGAGRGSATLSCWGPSRAASAPAAPPARPRNPRQPGPAQPSAHTGPAAATRVGSAGPLPVASAAAAGKRLRGAVPAPSPLRRAAPRAAMAGADSQVGRAGAPALSPFSAAPPHRGPGGVLRRGVPFVPR